MIALLDTSDDLVTAGAEIGCEVGQLLTPLTRFTRQNPTGVFAIDNGAYSRFDAPGFRSLLLRERHAKHLCKFVAVPDVVGSARRTLEVFTFWRRELEDWPLALVAQDGQEHLEIPWEFIAAVFVGGSTEWKMGPHAAAVVKAAKTLGKWVHAGRVNTPARFEYFEELGADSIDGSGLSRYSWMRADIYKRRLQPELWDATV